MKKLGINSCAALIKSMPTDQAIQLIKSDITGQPNTVVIDVELIVVDRKEVYTKEDIEMLITQNEDDFDRGKGKHILRDFINGSKQT